ncbi:MAG: DUF177 domain-containing protein [Vicinamibacterales bacterium]
MRLELSQFRQAETEFARIFQPAELGAGDEEYRVMAPVILRMTIHRDQDRFRLIGSVQAVLELDCSRCLEAFTLPVDQMFDLRYLPATTAVTATDESDEEIEVVDDDVSITFYRDEHIDLNELLREQFYLVLPMKPLCKGECQGICPQCGANRNLTTCDCSPHWEDPRMAGLKTLIPKRKHDDA